MRFLIAIILLAGSAEAKVGIDIEWGFMQGKAIFAADDNGNMRAGSNWEYVDVGFSAINRDSTMAAYGVGFQGFQAKSSAGLFTIEGKVGIVGLTYQRFLTPPGEKTRFYLRGGPALANIDLSVSAAVLGGFGLSDEEWRPGFRVGVGVSHRVSKSFVFLANMGYTYVNVDGTFDPSLFTATVGVGFGG